MDTVLLYYTICSTTLLYVNKSAGEFVSISREAGMRQQIQDYSTADLTSDT